MSVDLLIYSKPIQSILENHKVDKDFFVTAPLKGLKTVNLRDCLLCKL